MPFTGKLNKKHIGAGIVEVISTKANTNGTWVCEVRLEKVNHEANRPISKKHIDNIKSGWSIRSWGNPNLRYVNENGKCTLYSVNGQHRILAALEMGEESGKDRLDIIQTCDIYFDMSDEEAAECFYDTQQKSKRMNLIHSFAVGLRAKLTWAVEIDKMLIQHNLTCAAQEIGWKHAKISEYDLPHIGEFKKAQLVGKEFLSRFCQVLSECWKKGHLLERQAQCSPFQRGLYDFLQSNENVPVSDIVYYLGNLTAAEIAEEMQDMFPKITRYDRKHYRKTLQEVFDGRRRRRRSA